MIKLIPWLSLAFPLAFAPLGQPVERQPLAVFAEMGLTPKQVAAIDEGRPVAKVLSWGKPSEVYVFGAVHVKSSPAAYLKAARNIQLLARTERVPRRRRASGNRHRRGSQRALARRRRYQGVEELPRRRV